MGGLFTELQKEREKQQKAVKQLPISPTAPKKLPEEAEKRIVETQEVVTQNSTQVSNRLSKPLSKSLRKLPSTEDIENLVFKLRKTTKARVNADIPEEWKEHLDDLAHKLKVGKYDLIMYVIALFLEEVAQAE